MTQSSTPVQTRPLKSFFNSISFRMGMLSLTVLVLALLFHSLVTIDMQKRMVTQYLEHEGRLLSQHFADDAAHYLATNDLAALESLAISAAGLDDIAVVQVLDQDGQILTEVNHPKGQQAHAIFNPRSLTLPAGETGAVQAGAVQPGAVQQRAGDRMIFWNPVAIVNLQGWIRMELRTDRIDDAINLMLRQTLISIFVFGILAMILLYFMLRPYLRAIRNAARFAADLHWRQGQEFHPWKGASELKTLGTALRDVSRKLHEQDLRRTRIEHELRESERAHRTLTRNIPGIIYRRFTEQGAEPRLFNRMLESMTGYVLKDIDPVNGSLIDPLIHADDRPRIQDELDQSLKAGTPYNMEYRIHHKDGSIRHFLDRGIVVQEPGKPAYMDGIILDLTPERLAESALRQRQQELATAQEIAHLGSWTWDIKTGKEHWSDEQMRIFGHQPGSLEPDHQLFIDGLHPEDRDRVLAALEQSISGISPLDVEFRVRNPDGATRYIHAQARIDTNTRGQAERLSGTLLDISDRKRAELALRAEKEKMQVTLHSIGDAVISTDVAGVVEYLNPVAEIMTGWSQDEAAGLPIEKVFHIINEETGKPASIPVNRCLRDGIVVGLANHTMLISRSGLKFSIQDSAAPIRSQDGEIHGVVLVFSDVTETRRMSNEISYQASHDSLTGLINRAEFERRLNRVRDTVRATGTRSALCFLDLDQFKLVNDTCGHLAGDELLRQISTLLEETVRVRDTVARLGGDEFGLLMEHCSLEEATTVARKLIHALEEFSFTWEDKSFTVGVSIGLIPIDEYSGNTQSLLSAADSACYVAKERGRNQVHVSSPDDKDLAKRHGEMLWATRIPQALEEDRFRLFIQPISSLGKGRQSNTHYEVLLRIEEQDGSIIGPAAFLPAADRYNLSGKLDRWVINETFAFLAAHPRHVENLYVCAINLSGHSLNDETFLDYVHEQFAVHGVPPEKICFEITETVAIANLTRATSFVKALHSEGCLFALDDFGSGLSSFAYLKHIPVDMLKIDGQFVKDILRDPIDYAMVKSINEIGRVMRKQTIAEFVESDEIRLKLKEVGVDFAQGYGVGRPRPIETIHD